MGVIKKSKLFLGIFIPILAFFLMSENTFAVSLSGFNFLKVSYSFNGGSFQELIRHNTFLNLPDTLLAVPANTTSDRLNYFVVSGNLPSSNTGSYFNGSINFEILANADNTFSSSNCMGLSGYILPEQGSISESQSRSECSVSNNGRILNVSIITAGRLSTEATPSSWYSKVENLENYLFICSNASGSMSAPCRQQEIKINSAILNFNLTRDQTVAGLDNIINQNQTIINQNETIINNQNQNTQDIINNQNQNTQDIIRSNQTCKQSPNLLSDISWVTFNVTKTESDGVVHLTAEAGTLARAVFPLSGLESGQNYVLSAYVKGVSVDADYSYVRIRSGSSSGDWQSNLYFIPASSDFTRITIPFTASTTSPYSWFYLSASPNNTTNVDIYVKDIQLEKGNVATQYIPYGGESCKNINEEYYDEQRQADQNISNQSASDIQGAENQATTNLIGVLTGFISAFSNINATNCNLTLDFPNYAGGSRIVDICQGKEKAPRIVEIGSSLLLIGVFVPLAYILIKMIYNEIRSWTNG